MNAMLQQFYMVSTFRNIILMVDDQQEPNMQVTEKHGLLDDNVFHQLQRMFAFLQLSDRQYFDPTNFCYTYKLFG